MLQQRRQSAFSEELSPFLWRVILKNRHSHIPAATVIINLENLFLGPFPDQLSGAVSFTGISYILVNAFLYLLILAV